MSWVPPTPNKKKLSQNKNLNWGGSSFSVNLSALDLITVFLKARAGAAEDIQTSQWPRPERWWKMPYLDLCSLIKKTVVVQGSGSDLPQLALFSKKGNFKYEDWRKFVYIQKALVEYPTKREKPTEKRIKTNQASLLPISIKGISIPLQTWQEQRQWSPCRAASTLHTHSQCQGQNSVNSSKRERERERERERATMIFLFSILWCCIIC